MAQLQLVGINKLYSLDEARISAVHDVSLTVNKGEFISIVGHSGSGKTTLLSIIGGILKPTSGQALFDGSDIYARGEDGLSAYRASNVGYMFQFASLMPVLTAKENLLLPTLFKPGTGPVDVTVEELALHYLDMVGLADKANAYPSQLSGGQQRRVAIARSLMNEPQLLLADEPTGDLDEDTEEEVMKLFMRVNKERGITFLLVTHSTELAARAGRKLRMTHGRLEELS